ncbi:unnamed protein product [Mesocestoides corti]|nr:unnamed protein product [Mesocestoides corti]
MCTENGLGGSVASETMPDAMWHCHLMRGRVAWTCLNPATHLNIHSSRKVKFNAVLVVADDWVIRTVARSNVRIPTNWNTCKERIQVSFERQ